MAEPPGSEGRVAKPPPVPPSRAPARGSTPPPPRPSRSTQREFGAPGSEEATQRVATLADFAFVEEVVELLSAETEALAARGDSEATVADMHLRMALLSWDATDDDGAVVQHLEQAQRHPLAPRLLLAHALSSGAADRLASAQAALARLVDGERAPAERAALALALAEA